jgi:putative peptide zinc metalloprotease protein
MLNRLLSWFRRQPRTAIYSGAALAAVVIGGAVGAAADSNGLLGATQPTAAPSATPLAGSDSSASTLPAGGGGAKNIVLVINRADGHFRRAGKVQFGVVPGPTAAPVNLASAYSSCTDCQTLAVALQVDLISESAHYVAPQNSATATNFGCNNCITVAVAYQYAISVADPTQVPPDVHRLVAAMNHELNAMQAPGTTLDQAIADVQSVIDQFPELLQDLSVKRDQTTAPSSPNATPLPSASPSASGASPQSSASVTPSPSPSLSPTASPTTS